MQRRVALAGCFLLFLSVSGGLLAWGWLYCCATSHDGVLLIITGTLQGVFVGLLSGGASVVGKLQQLSSFRGGIVIGFMTVVPFMGFVCIAGVCSDLVDLFRNQSVHLEAVALFVSPIINGIVLALLSMLMVHFASSYIREVRLPET
jgi:hypothetical protein